MKIDIKNTTFLSYLDNVTKNILLNVNVNDYFKLSDEQKLTTSYTVFTLLKSKINDTDLKTFILVLRKKNEFTENYELASLLDNIIKKYDKLSEIYNISTVEIKKKKLPIL